MEKHLRIAELEAGLPHIQASPCDLGSVELIVRRPKTNLREELHEAELDVNHGLIGDNWFARGNRHMPDGRANPNMQLNIMNSRAIALIAQEKNRWQLAGDQLYIDFNLSYYHIPPGTLLKVGEAIIEVTAEPHLGCKKFSERFGRDAVLFVNSDVGKSLNLRGINAKVVQSGKVKVGARVERLPQ